MEYHDYNANCSAERATAPAQRVCCHGYINLLGLSFSRFKHREKPEYIASVDRRPPALVLPANCICTALANSSFHAIGALQPPMATSGPCPPAAIGTVAALSTYFARLGLAPPGADCFLADCSQCEAQA